jgi:hypothetical protein
MLTKANNNKKNKSINNISNNSINKIKNYNINNYNNNNNNFIYQKNTIINNKFRTLIKAFRVENREKNGI